MKQAELLGELQDFFAGVLGDCGVEEPGQVMQMSQSMSHAFVDYFGGSYLYIPQNAPRSLCSRNAQILQMRRQGVSISKIAKILHLSEVRIYQILQAARTHKS